MKKVLTGAAIMTATVGALLAGHIAPAQAQADNYGALALSRNGASSITANYGSYAAAESAAIAGCQRSGGGAGCDVKVSWRNGCGALAESSRSYSWASAPSLRAAKRNAINANRGAATIINWNCTSGYEV
ncbi:DUF4189 domain-containing protein [Nocardia neocaledoniensis]|uniref:DUF4189 domain-containing protein n=1 Tax=Nocardia neocaledoniensis TaxID=236511 RepID=UPI002456824F|nr:DUF4189 domain-containing protein [Nocardia neocaledoniensis]